ncbi:hypothetical protein Pdw03_3681 [Penicillium digitatum]|uniref:DUF7703 domain-containing protein n=3 Tax=Penicillium digitatum TaxID=36651 RepID=K9FJG0_PEND2|nr:hypothetical protein PDIP_77700 [Penicillium digitatum Pd1]EKV06734.1 hypothetical protein PDIP_77700 [Penicillium digitatum Pd1]EKV08357.1 hypothetical protein PDIG_68410 [Penicillium digitatum PHI26]KAG0159673.1 hypothetical protein PDIDSM_7196 [Penicillium digitatum]QQK40827.1 hypothetical protein Pdw03_3681 [Penicillium digitatum]
MDTPISNLPPEVSAIFNANMMVVQVVAMFSISAWNALEVVIAIFEKFQKYRGLYFWSMQIAAWGILVHGIPATIRYTNRTSSFAVAVPFVVGWICMVTGQAVVLYSRLHLVVTDIRQVRWVRWLITANAVVLHIPMTVLFFLNLHKIPLGHAPEIYDRFQATGFTIQDVLLCAIYVREALRALKPVFESKGPQGRRIIHRIIFVNLIGISLSIFIIIAEYRLHYLVISFRTVVYSIKLKLEFHALTQLRELTSTYACSVCQGISGTTCSATEINIFDMLANNPASPETEARNSAIVAESVSLAPYSARSCTYDFHEALRQATSTVNSFESQECSRYRMLSSDSQSTVEMTFLERPK